MEQGTTSSDGRSIEPMSPGTFFINKILSTILLLGLLLVVMGMSWLASPGPFVDLVGRSVPIIVLVAALMIVTVTGASVVSRFIIAISLAMGSILMIFILGMAFWGALYLMASLALWFDFFITLLGCKSPLVMNSTGNFLTFVILFGASFGIGFFFEYLNAAVIHAWDITSMASYYPIIDVLGVNLLIVFNWGIVGVVIFEFMLFVFIVVKRRDGNNMACSLGDA